MNFIQKLFQRKQSRALTLVSQQDQGAPRQTPRNYDAMAKQGYQINDICYDAVQRVAKGVANLKWVLYQKKGNSVEEIIEHPILELLHKPNPMQAKAAFFESVVSYYQISGNTYIEGVRGSGKQFKELWSIMPTYITIIAGEYGIPKAYIFKYKGISRVFDVDQVSGITDLMHVKRFNPTDHWFGLSPLEPSMLSIDALNSSAKWNLGLLQNNARPGGLLTISQDINGGEGKITDEQFENLKEEFRDQYSGASNAGKVLILEGGMDWKQVSLSPIDLNFIEGNNQNARNISRALGVPPILLNIPGDSTYNNFKEARLALYEDTIIPIAESLRDEFNRWLVPAYGDNLYLDINKDEIDALNIKREQRFKQYQEVDYLTINEKRQAIGYEEIEGGDKLAAKEPPQPPPPEKSTPIPPAKIILKTIDPFEEIKQVNLITRDDKLKTARKLNALREFYGRNLKKELEEDYFGKITAELKKINTTDNRFAESQALRAVDSADDELKQSLQRALKRTAQAFGEPIIMGAKEFHGQNWETKKESDFTSWIQFFVKKRSEEAVQLIKGTTIEQTKRIIKNQIATGVDQGLGVGQIADSISDEFSQLSKSRTEVIARTEVAMASNQGANEAAKSLDIPDLKKEWVAVEDGRTRHDHRDQDGTRVFINEKFIMDDGTTMDGPGDPSAPAGQVINCRCVLAFSRS